MWGTNKSFKKYIMMTAVFMVIIIITWNFSIQQTIQEMSDGYYNVLAILLESVKEQYPHFREEEWIEILNKNELKKIDESILEHYGIFPQNMPILSQGKYKRDILIASNFLFVFLCVGILLLIWLYQRQRDKKIAELTTYIRKIEQGIYILEMEDNQEDELSGLKNELYKVTIMLKKVAEQSSKGKKALADSVSDISHQLKTPLTSCLVLLDNLSESEHMEEATRLKFLSEITRQITNVNWLVVTLLKLSRMDAGVIEFEKNIIYVDSMLEEVFENLTLMAEWKQIQLNKEGMCNVVIYGDKHWIKEAITNLVKNAIEHSPIDGQVIVHVDDNTVYTAISVIDFGKGISSKDQKHIFERFYKSSAAKEDSVGIGLALCKEIIERQNGYITVSSEEDKNTTFLIKFLKS